jgi:hypothetical protein
VLPYSAGTGIGYALGVAGAAMLLVLFAYPARKRLGALERAGPLPAWFRVHMACGILAPLTILAHSQLRVGSLNAAVALACMLLVAGSGIVGRFIYRQIHHGLYGRRTSLEELRSALRDSPRLAQPRVSERLQAFRALAERRDGRWPARAWRFIALGWQERAARRDCARACAPDRAAAAAAAEQLRLMRAAAHFAAYERLFSLWHVLHVPFVYMLAASTAIHVVAVHMY